MKKVRESKSPLKISIVIVTFRRAALIGELLAYLQKQTLSKTLFEIIVIGDTGVETRQSVEPFRKIYPHFAFYNDKNRLLPEARDFAFLKVRAPFVAITDDDTLPQKEWLENIIRAFEKNPTAFGIEGKIVSDEKKPLFANAPVNLNGGMYVGCNTHYRTAVLHEIRGHDPEFTFHREDTDIAFKVLKKGPIVFAPDVVVYHPARRIPARYLLTSLFHLDGDMKFVWRFGWSGVHFLLSDWIKNWMKSIILYALLMVGIAAIILCFYWITLACVLIYHAFKYFFTLRGRPDSVSEKIRFISFSFFRELAYPFFFIYYFFAEARLR